MSEVLVGNEEKEAYNLISYQTCPLMHSLAGAHLMAATECLKKLIPGMSLWVYFCKMLCVMCSNPAQIQKLMKVPFGPFIEKC